MDTREQRLDEEQLRNLPTGELVRLALEEGRALVKAELLHAKHELHEELRQAQRTAVLFAVGAVGAIAGVSVLFVCLALLLPLHPWTGALVVGAGLLLVAALLAFVGVRTVPRRPMPRTQDRLKRDLAISREQLS